MDNGARVTSLLQIAIYITQTYNVYGRSTGGPIAIPSAYSFRLLSNPDSWSFVETKTFKEVRLQVESFTETFSASVFFETIICR